MIPMSKILAVLGRMVVEGPYRMDPRNRQLGAWESGHNWTVRFPASLNILETEPRSCMLFHVINPVNLVESVPPNVDSPLLTNGVVPCKKRLSVTVGKGHLRLAIMYRLLSRRGQAYGIICQCKFKLSETEIHTSPEDAAALTKCGQ